MAHIMSLEPPKVLKAIFYGLGGSGKSTLCASALDNSRCLKLLWVDMAGNGDVAMEKFIAHSSDVTVLVLDQSQELGKIFDYLKNGQSTAHPWAKMYGLTGGYKTLVVDTITEMSRKIISGLLGVDKFDSIPVPSKEAEKLQMQHYNTTLNWTMSFGFSLLQNIPDMNVFITAQEKVSEFSPANRAALYGQAVTELPGYAKLVGRLTTKNTTKDLQSICAVQKIRESDVFNVLQIKASADVDTVKVQYGNPLTNPRDVVNPTITKLFDLLQIGK